MEDRLFVLYGLEGIHTGPYLVASVYTVQTLYSRSKPFVGQIKEEDRTGEKEAER